MDFTIGQVTVVKFGKNMWVPDCKVVNGVTFIGISKWCRQFVLFATGKALDFRKDKSFTANVAFIDTLIKLRKQASVAAITAAMQVEEDIQEPHEGRKHSRGRKRKVSWQEVLSAELTGPAFVRIKADGHEMVVLSELRSPSLWVEFNHANLDFIRKGVQESLSTMGRGSRPNQHSTGHTDPSDIGNEQSGDDSAVSNH